MASVITNTITFTVLGTGGCWAIASAFGTRPAPLVRSAARIALCVALGAGVSFLINDFSYHPRYVLPSGLAAGIDRALIVTGLLWAAGGIETWAKSVTFRILFAIVVGQFIGSVLLGGYYWLIYHGEPITDTFEPKGLFIYGAIGFAVFVQLLRIDALRPHIRSYSYLLSINIFVACLCLIASCFLSYPARMSAQDQLRNSITQGLNGIVDKLQEKGVFDEKEADELRTGF